jgi:hypothetical protein
VDVGVGVFGTVLAVLGEETRPHTESRSGVVSGSRGGDDGNRGDGDRDDGDRTGRSVGGKGRKQR